MKIPSLSVLFFVWLLLAIDAHAQSIAINDDKKLTSLGLHIEVLTDESTQLKLRDILENATKLKFIASKQEIPNFQMTEAAIWCRVSIRNELKEPIYLELGSAFLDSINIYVISSDGTLSSFAGGDLFPYTTKQVKTNSFLFKLPLEYGEQKTIYIRVKCSEPLQFPLNAGTILAYYEYDHTEDFIQGIYYGFMLLMVLYNLSLFLNTGEKLYLYYILYVASVTTFISFITGYSFEYLWPATPWINKFAAVSTALTLFFSLVFTRKFLSTDIYAPKLDKIGSWLRVLPLIITVLAVAGQGLKAIMFSQVSLLLVSIYFIVIGLVVFKRGYRPARFYVLAWSALVISIFTLIFKDINILPYNIYTINALQIGSGLEVLLLSFAVADKINILIKDKEEAQASAILSLEENGTLVREQNIMLERKVVERTHEILEINHELEQQNEEIMIQRDSIYEKSHELKKAYTRITDSVRYAQKIQEAILGDIPTIISNFKDAFILFRPKDIVSGDFYWYGEREGCKILIAADCTGHGVPGAFMTVMGNDLLNDIIHHRGLIDPGAILEELDNRIISTTQKQKSSTQDGMDIAILVFEPNGNLLFAGAKNPLYLVRNREITKFKGSLFPIGSSQYRVQKSYQTIKIDIEPEDALYLCSDGYQDQFGGPVYKKFLSKNFTQVLLEFSHLSMTDQKENLEQIHDNWKQASSQTDDILVVGVRV